MLELHLARSQLNQLGYMDPTYKIERVEQVRHLYERARWQAKLNRAWSKLRGYCTGLIDLETALANSIITGRHHKQIETVPIRQIRGSEGRNRDFDNRFNPLQAHTEQRWFNLALALLAGVSLPPVVLIQLGDIYFVRDGHHRISVAHALGQKEIEAEIIVWEKEKSTEDPKGF
jgi:hypothetical protein